MTIAYDYYRNALSAIELISQGRTRTHACDEANITIAAFVNHVKQSPELEELLNEAETRGYDAMADALLRIDNHAIYGQSDAKMAKVISDNIKWLLSKRKQKEYGDRLEVTHNITADRAITAALAAGRQRVTQAMIEGPTVDVEFSVVEAEPSEEQILAEILA